MTTEEPWAPGAPASWADVVGCWPWEEWNVGGGRPEGWRKAGSCPRCGHVMAVYQQAYFGLRRIDTVRAGCNCGQPHAGRPDDADFAGCGAEARIPAAP